MKTISFLEEFWEKISKKEKKVVEVGGGAPQKVARHENSCFSGNLKLRKLPEW